MDYALIALTSLVVSGLAKEAFVATGVVSAGEDDPGAAKR